MTQVTGELIRSGSWREKSADSYHTCTLPYHPNGDTPTNSRKDTKYPTGALWRCECGKFYKARPYRLDDNTRYWDRTIIGPFKRRQIRLKAEDAS